jgi:hypothetical protein
MQSEGWLRGEDTTYILLLPLPFLQLAFAGGKSVS